MSTATNGRAREYRVRDAMTDAGWLFVMRSAGSKGAADLCMVHPFHGLSLVQVGTANKQLGPADRDRFVTIAEACGALPLLASCAPRIPARFWVVSRDTASTWKEWLL
jgi:hypothetical protein